MPSSVYLLAALIYSTVAVYFWRRTLTLRHESVPVEKFDVAPWIKWMVLAGIVLHGAALELSVFGKPGLNLGLGNALSLIVWLTVVIYWLGSWLYPVASLQMFVLPIAAIGVLLAQMLPSDRVLTLAARPALAAHLVMSMLAYSLFTIAALHAILTSVLDRGLHQGTMPATMRDAPPLIAMEQLLLRIIQVGFVLLTLALISGFLFSEQVFGKAITFPHNTHKILFGVLSWGIFGAFLIGHRFYGWRGRTAAMLTLVGFGLLLVSYIGSKFFLEVLLQRA
ncbi:MAG: cytochrome c biogenesis protein CcsA [Pseudomonadota bacterium]|nr:cytochrome c biogenesis protein CcsA [Pseudomonadota bacterium]